MLSCDDSCSPCSYLCVTGLALVRMPFSPFVQRGIDAPQRISGAQQKYENQISLHWEVEPV